MNRFTSQQRKLVYLSAIVVLLIPIIWLGMPATGESGSGGKLAQLRQQYDLGENTLGEIDPTSATMTFMLLGLRGIASNLLWIQAIEEKETKNWAALRTTVDSIVMLQPHYLEVWRFQGWNLAYNVSAEWDLVSDRYYWVKEGAKFYEKGTERNSRAPELYWEVGRVLGQKIGRSDEWRLFRKYFLDDPDPKFEGRPDPELNPAGKDNYLAAKDVFYEANKAEDNQVQHIMMRALFRQYPARSQLDYADALQRHDLFDEVTQVAWAEDFRDWPQNYGRMEFESPGGTVVLESTEDDIQRLAKKDNVDIDTKRHWTARYQDTTNYRYWRTRALAESEPDTVAGHRELFQGKTLFKEGKLDEAEVVLYSGMEKWQRLLQRYPELTIEDETVEIGLSAILLWQYIHQLKGEPLPETFPLQGLWLAHQNRLPEIQNMFNQEFGIR